MKRIRHILIIFLLLTFAFYTKGQESPQMMVHKNGNIFYITNLASSDSITFSQEEIRTFKHIKNGEVVEIPVSEIDSITFGSIGVLINDVIWATRNVNAPGMFASHPSESGMFYQWNRHIGWSATDSLVNSEGDTIWNSSIPTGSAWEVANNPCPTGWRIPTQEEQRSLFSSGSSWGKLNGISGRFFGNGDQRVFFPAAGYRHGSDGELGSVGSYGYYWSSTPDSSEFAHYMVFDSSFADANCYYRNYGLSVRCVKE